TDLTQVIAPHYDFVFTLEKNCLSFYKSLGCQKVYYLPLAADPDIFHPKSVDAKYQTDILFIGVAFSNRLRFFDTIADYLSRKNVLFLGLDWHKLKNYHLLKQKIGKNAWTLPEETANYYNGAKIVINMHRPIHDPTINRNKIKLPALSLNPRTFEISACGAFQLTDIRPELENFYSPGYDIATYTTPNELMHKIDYYLSHEDERKIIATRGLNKTQTNHTFSHRISQLLNIIFD
ncbi:spore maturation protein cgeB, partial [Bacillus pseudomycoides]